MKSNTVNNIYSKLLFQEVKNISFKLSELDYAIIKGEPLSILCYNKAQQRYSTDIDFLISRRNVTKLKEIFFQHGFENNTLSRENEILSNSFSHQLPPFVKKNRLACINFDLNFDIFWGEYTGKRIDIDEFLSDAMELEIYGCKIKTLPPLKAMVQLILHHYKEMNSIYHLSRHNSIHYNMFKDVYYLWKNNRKIISLKELENIGKKYEIIPFLYYILFFTNQIFNDFELQQYVDTFSTPDGVELLEQYGLAEKEKKEWKVDFKTRLSYENLFEFIKDDLSEMDMKKLERNRRIFGSGI